MDEERAHGPSDQALDQFYSFLRLLFCFVDLRLELKLQVQVRLQRGHEVRVKVVGHVPSVHVLVQFAGRMG